MRADPADLLPARILVVDDERQIHASVRLRLGREYEMISAFDPRDALDRLGRERFDLCITDLHMPHMDGFTFIERARLVDPGLGYVILSAFDSGENLRRAIPLQVYDFVGKPLPDREGFELRLRGWIDRTRTYRRDLALAEQTRSVAEELATAQLAHEVELVASETARDALLQTSNLLTTIHAHFVTAVTLLQGRAKGDPTLAHVLRNLEGGRKTTEAAVTVAEGFFNSAYANRDSSPAYIDGCIRHAIDVARRICRAEESDKQVDFTPIDERAIARGVSGIDLLLMLVPAMAMALAATQPRSTVRITGSALSRLDEVTKDSDFRHDLWLNRKHALVSHPGLRINITAYTPPLTRNEFEEWLKGGGVRLSSVAARGLVSGLRKSHGMLACATPEGSASFRLLLALPV